MNDGLSPIQTEVNEKSEKNELPVGHGIQPRDLE